MKKSFLILATAALFAACSNEKAITIEQPVAQQQASDDAIRFGVYVNRTTTRAGYAGTITNEVLKKDSVGFGVFGYYTDNDEYTQYSTPNFMYNQKVAWDGSSAWSYSPIKYWPNEYGTGSTGVGANSDDQDKLSFFAYAPYVEVIPTNGLPKLTENDTTAYQKDSVLNKNIISLTRNTASGDPLVKYVVDTDPSSSVDLLWGVSVGSSDASSYKQIYDASFSATDSAGWPYIDLVKQRFNAPIKFNFKHALAKLNVQIDAIVDDSTSTAKDIDSLTHIYIRSITFSGIAMKGVLNLNNSDVDPGEPLWLDFDGRNRLLASDVTFYDGRKDGKEAAKNGVQRSELPVMINDSLIQTSCIDSIQEPGVTKKTVNLFNSAAADTASIYVIPTGEPMSVRIVYDVETKDPNLATRLADGITTGSSIENNIYKEEVFGGDLTIDAGKAYTLKLHLGMTSVKFDATVTDWDKQEAIHVDLPENNDGEKNVTRP